ncbi:hypothetical protein M433DRAFT_246871 [Acidomyces richmondensis BFW]|nr:MAG: hypothetical protein FE78DRAFT_31657 [Acidomyces sp. 'richmondensis']KYG45637.1 hypothetical protein M433DRAFT_246871 [Acidomyces richmondensis BFW]
MLSGLPAPLAGSKRKRASSFGEINPTPQARHPYLSGNFAPIHQTVHLTPCSYTGRIPRELAGGEYVRNGSNPVSNEDLGRDAHWFDGDGMLSGVSFAKDATTGEIRPHFANQFVLTDLYLSAISSPRLRVPILPSIATLVNPLVSFIYVTLRILRTVALVILSFLPGSAQSISRISVANTHVVYHDGRALALCESGPPMRVQLPNLETVGWYNGSWAEGEREKVRQTEKPVVKEAVLGQGSGIISFMREWTTAHPKIDPVTKEMMLFHASFMPPYVQYSILPQQSGPLSESAASFAQKEKMLNEAVPGVTGGRMMHDFGVSLTHTVIMDLPLSLDPMNQLKGLPPLVYHSGKPSRFGIFPRRSPQSVRWFETDACCIFHTANTWDNLDSVGRTTDVNMIACRLTSATVVFAAGNIAPPVPPKKTVAVSEQKKRRMPFFSKYDHDLELTIFERSTFLESPVEEKEAFIRMDHSATHDNEEQSCSHLWDEEQCRLYYYKFNMTTNQITYQWALAAVPCDFPSVNPQKEMQNARYIYGCSTSSKSFGAALGKATKIDVLVKVDAHRLIERGMRRPPKSVTGCVDTRTLEQVLTSTDADDPIRAFKMPEGWFAQEPRFVPASSGSQEDDGFLLFYAFDESQLNEAGEVPLDTSPLRAKSELWIIDAKGMKDIVCRVHLPQRVPYGLHGTWFSEEQIQSQRPVHSVRTTSKARQGKEQNAWMRIRDCIETLLG